MATTGHAWGDGGLRKTDGTGHHVGLRGDEDLEDRVPWDRSVGIDALGTVVSVWTDYEAVVCLDEACFVWILVYRTEQW